MPKCLCRADAEYIVRVEKKLEHILEGSSKDTQYYTCKECMDKLLLEYGMIDVHTLNGDYLYTKGVNR